MEKRFELTLCGVVCLRAPDGRDITPRLRKSRALLAYLALSGGRAVERATLEDLLWSDRMPRQRRDSLKQTLCEIRRAFSDAPEQPLCTEGGPVRLTLDGIRVDALESPAPNGPPLLEGIGIQDAPFRTWLERTRTRLAPKRLGPPPGPPPDARAEPFRIAILPPEIEGGWEEAGRIVNLLLDGFSRALSQTGLFVPIDLRRARDGDETGVDLLLGTNALRMDDGMLLSLSVHRRDSGATVWSSAESLDLPLREPARVFRLAAHCADQIGLSIWQSWSDAPERHAHAIAAFGAIRHISRLSPGDIEAADLALTEASEALGTSTLYAWRAYLTAYKLEKGVSRDELDHDAREFSARALEIDRSNPTSRALAAHAHSFVLRDHQRASEILSPVRGLVGQSALLADTVGLVHFYSGRYDEARAHARLACSLGRWSPMRYAFTTLLSVSEMMMGDMDGAIASGQQALAQHPVGLSFQYEPTLRTLAASCAMSGRLAEGRMVLDQLDRQTGQTLRQLMREVPPTVYPNPEVFHTVRTGIERLYA